MGLEPTDIGVQQDAQAQPAAPAQPQGQSFWESLLTGALTGLAGARGATSFGGGLAGGAAGELQATQQQKQNELAQDANDRANQDQQNQNTDAQAHQAQAQINLRLTSHALHMLDPHDPEYVQSQVNKMADQGDAGLKAGALLKTPEFSSAAEKRRLNLKKTIGAKLRFFGRR